MRGRKFRYLQNLLKYSTGIFVLSYVSPVVFLTHTCAPDVRDPDVPGQRHPADQAHPVPGASLPGRAGGGDQGDRTQKPLERRAGGLHHWRCHRCLSGKDGLSVRVSDWLWNRLDWPVTQGVPIKLCHCKVNQTLVFHFKKKSSQGVFPHHFLEEETTKTKPLLSKSHVAF